MKKSNVLALLAGLSVAALSAGCGTAVGNAAIDPILQAQSQGMIPSGNPRNNADNGPIDGNWARKGNTNCINGTANVLVESASYYIDNKAGAVIVRYYTSDRKGIRAIVSVPVTYNYINTAATSVQTGTTGTVQVTSAGPMNCEYADNRPCKANEITTAPNVDGVMTYTLLSANQLKVSIDRDISCSNSPSETILTQ
jgi:hypothetical protein